MSSAVVDFQSPSSSSPSSAQLPSFQNPNPSVQNHHTDSGIFNNGFNLMNSSKLEFSCSNDGSAPVRSSRRKHVKAKKQSSCCNSVSKKAVANTFNDISVVFNAKITGSVVNSSLGHPKTSDGDFANLGFAMGATNDSKLTNNVGSGEVQNSEYEFNRSSNFNYVFCANGKTEYGNLGETDEYGLGKINGIKFKAASNMSDGAANLNSGHGGHEYGDGVVLNVDKSECGGTLGKPGVDESIEVNNLTFEADSSLVSSMSGLNLDTRGPEKEFKPLTDESLKAGKNNSSGRSEFEYLDFKFSSNCRDTEADLKFQEGNSNEKVGKSVPNGKGEVKLNAKVGFNTSDSAGAIYGNVPDVFRMNFSSNRVEPNRNIEKPKFSDSGHLGSTQGCREFDVTGLVFGANSRDATSTEDLGKKNATLRSAKVNFGYDVKRNVECDYLKKLDNNMSSVLDGNYKFVFGSNLDNASVNVDETRTSNIHDPIKVGATDKIKEYNVDSCGNFNNLFVFGGGGRNVLSSVKTAGTSLDQHNRVNLTSFWSGKDGLETDEINKGPSFEYNDKGYKDTKVEVPNSELESSGILRKDNQPMNQNGKSSDRGQHFRNPSQSDAEVNDDSFPCSFSSSTVGLGFIPKVNNTEGPRANRAGIVNNSNFTSRLDGDWSSFTGFSTPDANVASSFTANMFLGLNQKLDFSTKKSVGGRKLKKTKAHLRRQTRSQGGHARLSNEVNSHSVEESTGYCSPMDVSPYGSADLAQTSTNPSIFFEGKDENAVDNTIEKSDEINVSSSSAPSFAQVDVPAQQRPHQKKYKIKTGRGLDSTNPNRRVEISTKATDQETCDKWRTRGNQAYKNGDLTKAEVYYTKGINSIPLIKTPGLFVEPLVLCFSNRAATRMALGRMREGLEDCRMAAALDPNFVKANLRSANCHLLLGEVEDALHNYNKCLQSVDKVCLDRRVAIEAADGLQKAQKVADYLKLSAEFLQQKTNESAANALRIITDALSMSCNSEKLLNMKGEALFMLRKYEDVVQLCEQSLDSAEKNLATAVDGYDYKNSLKLWRWNLMAKSYFHLGRLEIALDLIEKHEQLKPTVDKSRSEGPEKSLNALAITIRELLHCKNAGNEAFQCGRLAEAVEHYTAAISKSIESHSFAAVCFCNRAAAHQSLGEIIDAIGDCSIAIALDGSYTKALSRRATLHEMIRDYKQAANDLKRLISILEKQSGDTCQKSDTPARSTGGSVKDLRRARRRLSSIDEKEKKERSLDLYLILGLKSSDAASEVKKAYHKAALRHHPDKAGQILARTESGTDGQQWKLISESVRTDADRLFKMIGEAYAVLSDSAKRSKYDVEEETWEEMEINGGGSSFRRASNFYNSPNNSSNRRNYSQESRNSHYYYWQDMRKDYGNSHPRW